MCWGYILGVESIVLWLKVGEKREEEFEDKNFGGEWGCSTLTWGEMQRWWEWENEYFNLRHVEISRWK